jgi:hypothetical protein
VNDSFGPVLQICLNLQEVDEDTLDNPSSACLTGPLDEEGNEIEGGPSCGSSNLDINSIAEAHRERSKAQNDLKRQFEEFSRNLSFSGGKERDAAEEAEEAGEEDRLKNWRYRQSH